VGKCFAGAKRYHGIALLLYHNKVMLIVFTKAFLPAYAAAFIRRVMQDAACKR
jgi:hypothetical protein